MSIEVELSSLAQTMSRFRFAYLLTNRAGSAPRAVAVVPVIDAGELLVDGIGQRTLDNLRTQPEVGLVWPPASEGEYSLIVDGHAAADGRSVRIRPSRAVLHRPAPRPDPVEPGACGSDCVELGLPDRSS
jgi:hypothetical protein